MSKFKVGDKIRCVDNEYASLSITTGKVYEVKVVTHDCVRIVDNRGELVGLYNDFRFELANDDGKYIIITHARVYDSEQEAREEAQRLSRANNTDAPYHVYKRVTGYRNVKTVEEF